MHRTLKAETARPPRSSFAEQQQAFDLFCAEYNEERPHEGIDMCCPAALYVSSSRPLPAALPEIEYPGHFEVRSVRSGGQIKWQGQQLFLSQVLHRKRVGLEEVDDGLWSVYFGPHLLGRLIERPGGIDLRPLRSVR
jgi:putative transposase